MQASPAHLYEFGGFRLNTAKRVLRRLDGTTVPLTPRVFQTLLYLVEHNDCVLDKERLMEAVWPDSIVEENNLSQNISTLRRAFGESPGSQRYIVTVPGRGYRFAAEVTTQATEAGGEAEKEPSTAIEPAETERERIALPSPPAQPASSGRFRPILLASAVLL